MFQANFLKFLAIFLLMASVSSAPGEVEQSSEWEAWKSTHSKVYAHEEEELVRSAIWRRNKKTIDTHNGAQDSSYLLAMNEFGDMVIM